VGGDEWNRLDAEALEFHQRVRAGYLKLIKGEPVRWVVVHGDRPVEEVREEIWGVVEGRLRQVRRDP